MQDDKILKVCEHNTAEKFHSTSYLWYDTMGNDFKKAKYLVLRLSF